MQIVINILLCLSIVVLALALKKSVGELLDMHRDLEEEVTNRVTEIRQQMDEESKCDFVYSNSSYDLSSIESLKFPPRKSLNSRINDLENSKELLEKYLDIEIKTTPEKTEYVKAEHGLREDERDV